jgi:hypothetical protein
MSEEINKNIFECIIERSEKKDLDEFLKTFKGKIFNGPKGFKESRKYIQMGVECVVVFHSWWTVLRNGADWMNYLKLKNYMNDWNARNG